MKTVLFLLTLFVLSCSNANVKDEYQVRKESDGSYDVKKGMSMTPGKDDEKLEQAKYHIVKKNYTKAIKLFKEVYEDKSIKEEHREEALFQLGEVASNFLNPKKDYKKAVTYYEKLLKEFPKTKLKDKAEEKIANLKTKL